MKKNTLLLVTVLLLTAVLLAGCNTYAGNGRGFQRGSGNAIAAGDNNNNSLTRGKGSGNGNGNYGMGNGNGSYGRGNRNGSGGRYGNGYCLHGAAYGRQVSSAQSPAPENSDTSLSVVTQGYGLSEIFADQEK